MHPTISPFKQHCIRWGNGCGAEECSTATRIVLGRGKVPCDVCLIGEAPGESEDSVGIPFCGPAGKLLDQIIERSIPEYIRYSLTNIVGCLPRLEDGSKDSKPCDEQVKSCSERLYEFVELAEPKLIICVGTFSRDWLDIKRRGYVRLPLLDNNIIPIPQVAIDHPAFILRSNTAMQSLQIQKACIIIRDSIDEYVLPFLQKPTIQGT